MSEEPKLYDDWNYEGTTVSFKEWLHHPEKVLDAAQSEDIAIDLGEDGLVHLMRRERYIELSENTDFPDSWHDLVLSNRAHVSELWTPDKLLKLFSEDSTGEAIIDDKRRVTVLLTNRWYWRIEHVGPNNGRTAGLLSELSDEDWEGVEKACLEILYATGEDDTPKPGM
ncbi:hypothetical protein [Roseibium aggregatum]|jgi:hypothetical protein|uniref:Uncharacterized protein n=1 Tax=Roseibium aggregatum TaxID=187304 RepID=A0A0M6YEB0_9HYPH|nr:hypothetical protein [Roseibium aggregatum]CTQ47351.1 hypothetical protein LAL4801_05813 [Roseibium aggregatum]